MKKQLMASIIASLIIILVCLCTAQQVITTALTAEELVEALIDKEIPALIKQGNTQDWINVRDDLNKQAAIIQHLTSVIDANLPPTAQKKVKK